MKFWIDFSGYLAIEAENEQEAKEKFHDEIDNTWSNGSIIDPYFEIDNVEESFS